MGTPTEAREQREYTLTVVDADGNTAPMTFALALEPEDRQSTFGETTIVAQRWMVGTAVTLASTVEGGAAGRIVQQEGTRTYTVNGQQVTGTLGEIALTVPDTLDRDVTITATPPAGDVPLERGRYGFGPAGSRALVDTGVAPVPASRVDICLLVPMEVRTAAGERRVVLVRCNGQQWATVAGQVCAMGVTAFAPLAVGYANMVPTFEDRTIGLLTFRVNEAVEAGSPVATDGDSSVRHTLAPAVLPAGQTYTLTATLAFTLEVVRIPVWVTLHWTAGSAGQLAAGRGLLRGCGGADDAGGGHDGGDGVGADAG